MSSIISPCKNHVIHHWNMKDKYRTAYYIQGMEYYPLEHIRTRADQLRIHVRSLRSAISKKKCARFVPWLDSNNWYHYSGEMCTASLLIVTIIWSRVITQNTVESTRIEPFLYRGRQQLVKLIWRNENRHIYIEENIHKSYCGPQIIFTTVE